MNNRGDYKAYLQLTIGSHFVDVALTVPSHGVKEVEDFRGLRASVDGFKRSGLGAPNAVLSCESLDEAKDVIYNLPYHTYEIDPNAKNPYVKKILDVDNAIFIYIYVYDWLDEIEVFEATLHMSSKKYDVKTAFANDKLKLPMLRNLCKTAADGDGKKLGVIFNAIKMAAGWK